MKKLLVALAVATIAAQGAMAATGWLGSYAYLNANGGGNVYYDLNDTSTPNADFTGNIGTYNLGYTLTLASEINAWADGGDTFSAMSLVYRVNGGAWNTVTDNTIVGTGGNNFRADTAPASLSGLGVGVHTIELYLSRTHTWGGGSYTTYLNTTGDIGGGVDPNSVPPTGNFFNATFTVVPEPSTLLLAGLGLAGVIARRRFVK